ncbi:MAG: prolipoprotein diacylglyceryl transferase [Peptococcaceae bacterium]|nr:prolipoprotein diacylglyceryl transferase [Peptococcaceae bacterium]
MTIDPIAFTLGPFTVRWYGLLIATGMLIAAVGGCKVMGRAGIDEDDFLSIFMMIVVGAVLGARAYYVIFQWPYYSQHPGEMIAIWHGGLAIHGGLIGGVLAIILGCRYYKISFWQFADIMAPFVILGQAIGRWGNYFNQEAYGYEADPSAVPWAMWIDGAYRHPTFLYESCWDLFVFFILLFLARQAWVHRGEIALSYLMLYSMGRVVIEGFRTDSLMLGPLRMAQVMSLLLVSGALLVMLYRRKTGKAEERPLIDGKHRLG